MEVEHSPLEDTKKQIRTQTESAGGENHDSLRECHRTFHLVLPLVRTLANPLFKCGADVLPSLGG